MASVCAKSSFCACSRAEGTLGDLRLLLGVWLKCLDLPAMVNSVDCCSLRHVRGLRETRRKCVSFTESPEAN